MFGREPFYARAEERGNSEINQKLSLRRTRKLIYNYSHRHCEIEGILKSIEMQERKGAGGWRRRRMRNGPFHWLCTLQRYTSYFSPLTACGLDNLTRLDLMVIHLFIHPNSIDPWFICYVGGWKSLSLNHHPQRLPSFVKSPNQETTIIRKDHKLIISLRI